MKILSLFMLSFLVAGFVCAQGNNNRLNYADFEKLNKDNKPISTREGQVIFNVMAQNNSNKPKIVPKLFAAQAPLTQRLGFEFEITKPNDYATAYLRIMGQKDKGHLDDPARTLIVRSDDVSEYKFLSLDIGAAGVAQVRLELISEGNGIDAGGANQEKYVDVTGQLINHKIALSEFKQPTGDWVKQKYTVEQVLKKLTAVQISVVQVPSKGIVVVDNLAFEK